MAMAAGTNPAASAADTAVPRPTRPPRRRASFVGGGGGGSKSCPDPNVARITEARRAAMEVAQALGGGGNRADGLGNKRRSISSPAAIAAAITAGGAAAKDTARARPQASREKHIGGGEPRTITNGPPLVESDYTVPLKGGEADESNDPIADISRYKPVGRSVGFVEETENDDNASLLSQEASIASAALAVQRGTLLGSYEDVDHRMASDVSLGSHYDLDLTSVADTTITTKYGSPLRQSEQYSRVISPSSAGSPARRGDTRRKNKRKKKGKKIFPKASILKIKTSTKSVLSRSSRKKLRRKQSEQKAAGSRSVPASSGNSISSKLSWLPPFRTDRRLKTEPGRAVSFAGDRTSSDRRKKKKNVSDSSTAASTVLTMTKKATRDAYMCGLCGSAFSSYAKAEVHENSCIRNAFTSVGSSSTSRRAINPTVAAISTAPFFSPQQKQLLMQPNKSLPRIANASPRETHCSPHSDDIRERANTDMAGGSPASDRRLFLPPAPERDGDMYREPVPVGRNRAFTESCLEHPPDSAAVVAQTPFRSERTKSVAATEPLRNNTDAPKIDSASRVYDIQTCRTDAEPGGIHLSDSMRRCILMTDEAIVKVVSRATPLILTPPETDAERELALLARDRAYYEILDARKLKRMARHGKSRSTGVGEGFVSTVKERFSEAYRLIKEGDEEGEVQVDQYMMKNRGGGKAETFDIDHDDATLYINVVVKNSVDVITNELKRLAKSRWETQNPQGGGSRGSSEAFEWFRAAAQVKVVQLAGLALASDFTPRRIAVQLSNDLYRLLGPTLKARGVTIQTEIEYRAGAYFVLAVNIQKIDWVLLMKHTNNEVLERRRRWKESQMAKARRQDNLAGSLRNPAANVAGGGDVDIEEKETGWRLLRIMHRFYLPSVYELIGQCLALLYYLHWIVSVPICVLSNFLFLENIMKRYILTSTTDDIFFYVEQKGMEMDLSVKDAKDQASFMMAALREMRSDEKARKKKKAEAEGEEEATILGPLLGPAIKEDKNPAVPPSDFVTPENLEDVNFEMDLPVGFRRLRWALLHKDSSFIKEAVMETESKQENITMGGWDKHNDTIGLPKAPDGVNEADYIGATAETSYLMPKSAFVKANMAYETATIAEYNDYCLVLKKATLTPDVPYGGTFIAHTQIVITNTGNNSCKLVCSVEAEFPNGPPMVGRQIKSGMRAGTADAFVIFGETICKYAEHFP